MPAPLDRSVSWPYEAGETARYSYARTDHPTGVACEEELGRLDGGRALLFPSGMAAITATLLTMVRPGRTVAVAAGAYYGTTRLLEHLGAWGLRHVEFDQTGPPPDDVDLVWLEAPANPLLTMPDFEAAAAHAAPSICDATLATPLGVRPLDHGCAAVVHSATKLLGGHDDLLAGVVTVRDDGLLSRLHETRSTAGIVASADTAWLLQRGLRTLAVRLARQTATARALAARLREHPAVETVRYPDMGVVISFDVAGGEAAARVERDVQLIRNATSLGGTESKLEARGRWEGDRVPAGLLRLSVGLEDADDLWADLGRALDGAGR